MDVPSSLEPLIQEYMNSGQYSSVEELLRIALSHLDVEPDGLDELRAMIQEGLDELERGEDMPAEEVFANLRALQASYHEQAKQTA